MIFLLKVGNLFTLILAAIYCFQFWPYRRSILTKLYIINLFLLSLWSLSLLLTLFTDDFQLKVLFTKARQITNPFLTTNWLLAFIFIFLKSYWVKIKKIVPLLYLIPVATSLMTILSICGLNVESIVAHSFSSIANTGLVEYQIGPLLKLQFTFSGLLILVLMLLFIIQLFSKHDYYRKLARLFFSCAFLQFFFEFFSRSAYGNSVMIQFNTVAYIPMMIALYYAIHKMEFLNIKSFSNQMAFDNLPTPVLTINPRGEIWDANKKAFEIFNLKNEDLGLSLTSDSRFEFITKREKNISFNKSEYLVEFHNLNLAANSKNGLIVSLTDITELQETNHILKSMNAEILKITSFNKKIQAVLSHDLSGLLKYTFVSLNKLFKAISIPDEEKPFIESVLKTNQSSVELLNNILTWSHDELETEVSSESLLHEIVSAMSVLIKEHQVNLSMQLDVNKTIKTSSRMLEAILRNLISNAIKNSPVEGTVTIVAKTTDTHLKFSIIDEGPGIDNAILENIKEQRPSPKKSGYGFGIGLQITFNFVQQLDGMIHFESSPNTGTQVQLTFPLESHS